MSAFDFFYRLNDTTLFFLLTIFFIAISFAAIYLVKRFIPFKMRYRDNPVIGNVSGLIGIIYGVLVGLMALYLINNISATADAIQQEANAVADIYRDSKWLRQPDRDDIQDNLKSYLKTVIEIEWPLMRQGEAISAQGEYLIEHINHKILNYSALTNSESLLLHDMLGEIKKLYDARQERIHMSSNQLNGEIWFVILVGTFLIIMINFIYALNFYLHLIAATAVAVMAASMMFLLLSLDRPFQGEFFIAPNAYEAVLNFVKQHNVN